MLERAATLGAARQRTPADAPRPAADGGGVDLADARAARRARAPVRCAALRALARAWAACADEGARATHGRALLDCALACAASEWDVRVRALELVGACFTKPTGALLAGDAPARALAVCLDGLEDGKFVAVRKAAAAATRALVGALGGSGGGEAAAEVLARAARAVGEARARERDAPTALLLADVGVALDAATSGRGEPTPMVVG
jgi:hypothetical protein